jgi:ribulose-5-phosphate 4-epimerase/fuculose-1-phosphate aldolase
MNMTFEQRRFPQVFSDKEEHRHDVKRRLAAALQIFAQLGYDEGYSGHLTARDPIEPSTFWVNPFAVDFSLITTDELIRVSETGDVVEGDWPVNPSAFHIHARIHAARPDVNGAVHAHTLHGKGFSTLGRLPAPLTQDACAFFEDCALYSEYRGAILESSEGDAIAAALGPHKAVVLQNHGILTVGESIDSAAWWFIALERCCQLELLLDAGGAPTTTIPADVARSQAALGGSEFIGWLRFQPLLDRAEAASRLRALLHG